MQIIKHISFTSVIMLVLSGCASTSDLSENIQEGSTEKSLKYIESGVNLYEGDSFGLTPLHIAARKGDIKVIEAILDRGIDVNIKTTSTTMTPIEYAAYNNNAQVTKLLIERGATIDFADNRGGTSLKIASFRGNMAVIKTLLQAGAKINNMQSLSSTALMSAVSGKQLKTVKYLLRLGANIEAKDENDNTPLIIAAYKDNKEILKLLLDKGASVSTANRQGYSPLIIAAFLGKKTFVNMLLTKGANVHIQTNYGRSPLHLAAIGEHADLNKMLFKKGAKPTLVEVGEDDFFGTAYSHGLYGEWLVNNGLDQNPAPYLTVAVKYFKKAENKYSSIKDDLNWKISKNNIKSILSVLFAAYGAQTQAQISAKTSGTGAGYGYGQYHIYGTKSLSETRSVFVEKEAKSASLKNKYTSILKCVSSSHKYNHRKCIANNKVARK